MKVLTIIQASSKSTRLPGKIALPIAGKSILQHVVDAAPEPKIVTIPDGDTVAAKLCDEIGVNFRFGPFKDLLTSYANCIWPETEFILRLTADCPTLTPKHIEDFLRLAQGSYKLDMATVYTNRPWDPDGTDLELFSTFALGFAHAVAKDAYDREHVTPAIYRHFNVRRLSIFKRPPGPERPEEKVSVDTMEDYEKVRRLMEGK